MLNTTRHTGFIWSISLSFLFLGLLFSHQAPAQARDCCNTLTGDWISASSPATCEAKPGHVSIAGTGSQQEMLIKTQQAMPCMQKAQQQAMEYMGMPDVSTIPGMPQGIGGGPVAGKSAESEIADCCHIDSASWLGSMEVSMCLSEEGQFPDTDMYLGEVAVCNDPGGGGGASTEDVEINIPNGGFENWEGDQPVGFMNFDGGNMVAQRAASAGVDMQTVYKSSDAHTGVYSLQLVAKKMKLPANVPVYATAMIPAMAGGVTSCGDNCARLSSGTPTSDKAALALAITDDEPGNYLCGVYKGRFIGGDQLWINASVHSGGQIVGGTNSGSRAMNSISTNAPDWTEFKMPIARLPGTQGQTFDRATIELTLKPAGGIRDLGLGIGKVHEGTQVLIDSVRFCGDLQITLYKPKVIGISRVKISNPDEMDIGAQTFVNLDNDDKNAKFDIDDTDMGKDDNELIEMVLSLPKREYGYVELRLTSQADVVKVWEDARKKTEFTQFDESVEAPGFLEEKDGEWIKHLWIEGVKPSAMQRDIEFKFIYSETESGPPLQEDEVAITILGIESIELQGQSNSINDDNTLDADPNWPKGFKELKSLRVFPGKRWAGDKPEGMARDRVDVKVTLNVKPVEPVELAFRAMDVDDPSAEDNEVDNEDSYLDNRGTKPSVRGAWPEGSTDHLRIMFYDDVKTFEFQTTMQPGDNFRIVGGGDIMTLMELENDDAKLHAISPDHTMKIVDPDILGATNNVEDSRLREHAKYASDVLTVWRKLYLEVDTMGPVKDNELTANIVSLRDDGFYQTTDAQGNTTTTNQRQQWVTINKNLFASLPAESQAYRAGLVNNYRWGRMTIANSRFDTDSNTARASGNDEIRIVHAAGQGVLGDNVIGMQVTLIDDDAWKNDDVLQALPTERIKPAFEPAYILPVEDKLPNPTKQIPFQLHFKDDKPAYMKSVFDKGFDNKAYHEDADFWVVYLLNAFQGKLNEDGDGEGGLSGQTDGDGGGNGGYGAAVFQESGRETAQGYTANGSGTGWQLKDVAPHEIGHLFGAQHGDGGLMSYDEIKTEDFEPITLDKIRNRKYP